MSLSFSAFFSFCFDFSLSYPLTLSLFLALSLAASLAFSFSSLNLTLALTHPSVFFPLMSMLNYHLHIHPIFYLFITVIVVCALYIGKAGRFLPHIINWGAWLEINASIFTPAQLFYISDLNAVDEQALTYVSTHKPQRGQPGHFWLMDICRFRHVMELCNNPNFKMTQKAQTTMDIDSHAIPFVSGRATTPMKDLHEFPHPQSSSSSSQSPPLLLLPCHLHISPSSGEPHIFRTPIVDTIPHKAQWSLVKTVDISERLQAHLGDDRHYYNGLEYYKHEWPIVLKLLWPHICADTQFDCFWNWRDPIPIPCKLNWPKFSASFPPSDNAFFRVIFGCDFGSICGCPQS
jgi:hypothetical protein